MTTFDGEGGGWHPEELAQIFFLSFNKRMSLFDRDFQLFTVSTFILRCCELLAFRSLFPSPAILYKPEVMARGR